MVINIRGIINRFITYSYRYLEFDKSKERHMTFDIIQLMTFHKVDTVIYQPRGSDVHRSQRLR
jgi:hypothetical protein